jgi:hypothetical protein
MNTDHPIAHELFAELWSALNRVRFHGDGALPTAFAVTDFAAATFAAAGAAVGELLEAGGWPPSVIDVDRVMASGWFHIFPPGPSQPLSGSQRKGAWQPPAIFADGGPWAMVDRLRDGGRPVAACPGRVPHRAPDSPRFSARRSTSPRSRPPCGSIREKRLNRSWWTRKPRWRSVVRSPRWLPWLTAAVKRLHQNVLATALANKLPRIAWTVLAQRRNYESRVIIDAA